MAKLTYNQFIMDKVIEKYLPSKSTSKDFEVRCKRCKKTMRVDSLNQVTCHKCYYERLKEIEKGYQT